MVTRSYRVTGLGNLARKVDDNFGMKLRYMTLITLVKHLQCVVPDEEHPGIYYLKSNKGAIMLLLERIYFF